MVPGKFVALHETLFAAVDSSTYRMSHSQPPDAVVHTRRLTEDEDEPPWSLEQPLATTADVANARPTVAREERIAASRACVTLPPP